MLHRSYGQMKSELARVSGSTGFNVSDPRLMARFNSATEELMHEGDWPGVVDRYLFTVTSGSIVLPSFLDRAMGIQVNNLPYAMRSPWFEFVEYGPGQQSDNNWLSVVIDRDETATQVALPIGTGWQLYTKGEVDERVLGVRPYLTVRGRKTNGRDVRSYYVGTGYIDGERLEINGDTSPYTCVGTASFDVITSIIKPVTRGYVELWANNGSTSLQLATYGPKETAPSFHSYFLPTILSSNPTAQTVLVRGRKRFVPVTSDDDIVIISNVRAMSNMLMALQKAEVSDMDGYMFYKNAAIDLLKKEAKSYRGAVKAPPISFDKGGSVGAIPYIR